MPEGLPLSHRFGRDRHVLALKRERVLTLLYLGFAIVAPSATLAEVADGAVRDV